jgi:hypothetical protein
VTEVKSEGEAHGRGNKDERTAPRVAPVRGTAKLVTKFVAHDAQRPMLAVERGIIMSSGALGSGKSEPGSLMLLRWALRYPRREDGQPTQWYAIAPDFRRIRRELFKKLLGHCRKLPVNVVKRVTFGLDPKIVLCHGQTIYGASANDPDRLRAYEIDGAWWDEIEQIPEKAFRIGTSRLRSTDAIRIVMTGSPEDAPSWNWNLISGESERHNKIRQQLLESGSGFWCFRWASAENKSNDPGVLGTVRAVLEASEEGISVQELEGRYPGTHEAPTVGVVDYQKAFVASLPLNAREATPAVLGVDVGETHDYTWLTVLGKTGVVLYMERWNADSPSMQRGTFYLDADKRIREVATLFRVPVVVIDIAKAGKPVSQYLAAGLESKAKVESYATDAVGKKVAAIEALMVALSRGDVKVPLKWIAPDGTEHVVNEVSQLRKEFSELIRKDVGQGKRQFHHPQGGHDDGIVSLALALHGLGKRAVEVDLSPWLKGNKLQVPGSKWATPFGPGFPMGGPFSPFGRRSF